MKNREQLLKTVETRKNEYKIALAKGNKKLADWAISEIIRLQIITNEEVMNKNMMLLEESKKEGVVLAEFREEAYLQEKFVTQFKKAMMEDIKKKNGVSNKLASDSQKETIRAGLRDRVGIQLDDEQLAFVNKLNVVQASELVQRLRATSFYNHRVMLTSSIMKNMKDNENFALILKEMRENMFKNAWFKSNPDLVRVSDELQDPTEAQIRRIADVAKYVETHYTLENDYDINVDEYEYRPDGKNTYAFNWTLLKNDIKEKFNKESASNFIQTYDYITNIYEGTKLERDQMNNLRRLYTQLGEYEKTKLTYLCTINQYSYDRLVTELDEKVRLNKIAGNQEKSIIREAMGLNTLVRKSSKSRQVRSIVLKTEQQEAKEMCDFIFGMYSCIGQEVPDEMNRLLPYFIQKGEIAYATVEECHYGELRRMVFEQRDVIKEVDPMFNWAMFVCGQPLHILKALGLDMMI